MEESKPASLRFLNYGLSISVDELREYASKNDLTVMGAKMILSNKLPKSKLQMWDDISGTYLDVPNVTKGMTIKDLVELS